MNRLCFPALVLALTPAFAGDTFTRPEVIRWGSGIAELEGALSAGKLCERRNTRRIDPPFLEDIHDRQMQIDCEGFPFMGKPRHVEFVIGDDSLEMVWIMTTAAEADALIEAMTHAYGAPTRRSAKYVAFERERAALRFQPAEVLFYSPRVAASVESEFK